MRDFGLSDEQLFPLLDEAGRETLRKLREHPHAPRYNWRTGERLDQAGLARVRAFADELGRPRVSEGRMPDWVPDFVRRCRDEVPYYRHLEQWSDRFEDLPVLRREAIRKRPWDFVPDTQPVGELIVYTASGTSGTRLLIPATPELPAKYLPLIERALERVGVVLERGKLFMQVCAQRKTVVLCSVSSYLGGAGFVKVNLDPADWHAPEDAAKFIEDCAPQLITGDPFALWRLAESDARVMPKAIVSAGTAMSEGLRKELSTRFACPVIDMYSMNESGPVGFSRQSGVHEVLSSRLYVEVLDEKGRPCGPGVRGEVVLTGGLNTCLPLVRYATGDTAVSGEVVDGTQTLLDLQGRKTVLFHTVAGQLLNSVDVSTALADLPLAYVSLHQNRDRSLKLRIAGDDDSVRRARAELERLFGEGQAIRVERETDGALHATPVSFSSDLAAEPR